MLTDRRNHLFSCKRPDHHKQANAPAIMGFCLNEAIRPNVVPSGRPEGIQNTKGQVALPAVYSLVFRLAGRALRGTPHRICLIVIFNAQR